MWGCSAEGVMKALCKMYYWKKGRRWGDLKSPKFGIFMFDDQADVYINIIICLWI